MRSVTLLALAGLLIIPPLPSLAGEKTADNPAKEALQPLNVLVGTWKGTGTPEGSLAEKQKGFWIESIDWQWKFKGAAAWLEASIEKGKYYKSAEMKFDSTKKKYVLTATTLDKQKHVFAGELKGKTLTLTREAGDETQRIVFSLLHHNRHLYRYDVKVAGKTLFAKKYTVGATKEGEPFAAGSGQPECIVSGGLGTMTVTYQGKTYYVCCSGCRTEFYENPAMYVKEYETKKAKKR